jgi:hypothetical protein
MPSPPLGIFFCFLRVEQLGVLAESSRKDLEKYVYFIFLEVNTQVMRILNGKMLKH